ncbi:hypothetical protein NQ315_013005 [Exocentrus adspersus]|uniref:Uncharacterized protein n=1 Tax=Exocentrus adspersus TaxID=1586481 RepID=A0AAV8VRT6_9CUCU|nr:hypothetical protein NQ315_013005 [Exocentrus adspersus]
MEDGLMMYRSKGHVELLPPCIPKIHNKPQLTRRAFRFSLYPKEVPWNHKLASKQEKLPELQLCSCQQRTTPLRSNIRVETEVQKFPNSYANFESLADMLPHLQIQRHTVQVKINPMNRPIKFYRYTVTTPSRVKVPTYDGKVSWNTYLRQFEVVVRNWREEDKATLLIPALRGEALEVLRTIPEASPNYAMLTSALERRYGDAHLQHVYQVQLRSRRQRFEETLQQYEANISRMVNLAYLTAPAEVIGQLSVSSFIEGLRDPEIGQLVRLARHKTISEALAHTLEIEAVKEASRVATNPYQDEDKKTKKIGANLIDSLLALLQQFNRDRTSEVYPEWRKKTNSLLDVWC